MIAEGSAFARVKERRRLHMYSPFSQHIFNPCHPKEAANDGLYRTVYGPKLTFQDANRTVIMFVSFLQSVC